MEGKYSTTSDLTHEVCKKIGANFGIRFVETARRGDEIFVRATIGTREEVAWLRRQCMIFRHDGLVYAGHDGGKKFREDAADEDVSDRRELETAKAWLSAAEQKVAGGDIDNERETAAQWIKTLNQRLGAE
jgi:hypothetical protein